MNLRPTVMLDAAEPISRPNRMQLAAEYGRTIKQIESGEIKRTEQLRLTLRANEIRAMLGADAKAEHPSEDADFLRSVIDGKGVSRLLPLTAVGKEVTFALPQEESSLKPTPAGLKAAAKKLGITIADAQRGLTAYNYPSDVTVASKRKRVAVRYQEGDIDTENGVTYEFRGGRWVAVESKPKLTPAEGRIVQQIDEDMANARRLLALRDPKSPERQGKNLIEAIKALGYNDVQADVLSRQTKQELKDRLNALGARRLKIAGALDSAVFDRAPSMPRRERMALLAEYGKLRGEAPSASRVARMTALRRMGQIRALFVGEPVNEQENEHVSLLRAVLQGVHDALALGALLEKIGAAIDALASAGDLQGDIDQLGEQAIEHWAALIPVEA